MKQQTPMRQLINFADFLIKEIQENNFDALAALVVLKCKAKKQLEKEKEHIIEAYLEGADYTNDEHVTLAKEFYNNKYQNK